MADQEPLYNATENTENTAGDRQDHAATSEDARPVFPAKVRVHALAKQLGQTSKQLLSALKERGLELRSAQSTVERSVAEAVWDATKGGSAVAEKPSAGEQLATPAVETPELTAPAQPAPEAEPALFSAATPAKPSQEADRSAAADVGPPLFLPPPSPAEGDEDAERGRRRKRTRKPKAEADAEPEKADKPEKPEKAEKKTPEPPADTPAETETAKPDSSAADDESDEGDDDGGKKGRRRRRGRRGRGRGKGEAVGGEKDSSDSDEAADTTAAGDIAPAAVKDVEESGPKASAQVQAQDTDEADNAEGDERETSEADDDEDGGGSSRRRRRRRRRRGGADEEEGAEPSPDDPPNTVIHEREPRNKSRKDEVQGISGSTRLEAKRQRRKDGRDAVRRRPPILTEAEFLARRESVDRVMVVREKTADSQPGTTTQIAVLEDGMLVEHFVTSASSGSIVGNVYLGRVQNVLPSMEAAFVDIGRGRNGVLYAGEVNWDAAGLGGNSRKIEQALKPGDQVLVQVSKDPVGHKGARLTTQISLAGRFLVYVPDGTSTGISRKLPDNERKRLKDILREIVPADAGVIIRTASEGVSAEELGRDIERLRALWASIDEQAQAEKGNAPKTLYEEPDLLVKVVRDLFNEDFSRLVVQGDRVWSTVEGYVRKVAADMLPRVEHHESGQDVFETFRIDEQIVKALDRKVWLPSGGTLVIDRTEAMTVIDVNTGKFTGSGGNLEETVTRNNLEAAEEIVRQLRLRDIGGMVVIDFIDMVLESNRDLVLRRLTEALSRDRTRHQVSEVTSLGLVQMTRKRIGTGLVEAFSTPCEHCHGRGILVHEEPVDTQVSGDGKSGLPPSGRRARRSKVKQEPAPAVAHASPEELKAQAQSHSKHPMILAMAGGDHEKDAADVAVAEVATAVEVAQTVGAAETSAPQPLSHETAVAAQVSDEPESGTGAAQPPVPPAAAEASEASDSPEAAESTGAGTPGRRRRVIRSAAPAQSGDRPAPTEAVFSLPVSNTVGADGSETPQPEIAAVSAEVAAGPVTRRRRAAARPAGPPVDAGHDEVSEHTPA
ncbi:translation initiation factor IF-2 N-terminal domain-containing protein [Hoyosella sp. YIM 151337]|uniref:translation initiation factor IF-2 N-terminal domain-containing protein n=1 Tax=Hoyosella sp. YIM 151337 TaxID=2992742 RepID=UPI002235FA98|nr:translation initiation factor IF-2 N-terminal domain-containing protein [Hoyosella sp. YIM 151337]MCW4355249.1 translation initiation factor IF-2 N-terminal domain-containing protein [Hoyosella sp. YIM 151337]